MIELIDIHTHRLEKEEGIISIFNISLPYSNIPENQFISVGWHPWNIGMSDSIQIENTLIEIAHFDNLLAFGECGLDRTVKIPIEKQVEVFKIHLKVAEVFNKPLIIHCVKSYSDLLETLKNEKFKGKFVIHNFNGNHQQINSFLDFDVYFSMGKQLLNQKSKLTKNFSHIPLDRLFIETDESECSIEEMYFLTSNVFLIPVEDLKPQVKQNFTTFVDKSLID